MADIIKLKRDTAANWTLNNPILAEGEVGVETDTKLQKTGDGVTAWNSLPYMKVECMQEIGQSTDKPMSQKAVTKGLNNAGVLDISSCNNNTHYANLSAAILAIPPLQRKGGMTIKFILKDENEPADTDKYVQYFLKSSSFSENASDWQYIPNLIHMSEDDYEALSEKEKMNGDYYFIDEE